MVMYLIFWPLCGILAFTITYFDGSTREAYTSIRKHLSYGRGFGHYVWSSFVWSVCIGPICLVLLVLSRLDREEES